MVMERPSSRTAERAYAHFYQMPFYNHQNPYIPGSVSFFRMLEESRLMAVAELIRDHISLDSLDRFCATTGIAQEDFVALEPCEFEGEIYAVDGSNVAVCGWSVASLNLIRAGYAVYQGRSWKKTVVTYDDIFLADPMICAKAFDSYLEGIFGLPGIDLKESDLDRLSTYFRELQEYVALNDAVGEARAGDLILYDGSFDVFEPLRGALLTVFRRAEDKGVALLAVSKSSTLCWGDGISLPFVQHTAYAGSLLAPGVPWYLRLRDKNVEAQGKWDGETCIVRFDANSDLAFRVDAPSYFADDIGYALCRLSAYSCSAECLGYPHALFRAHRDIRITDQEKGIHRLRLMEMLAEMGMSQSQVRMLVQDYHDVLEMRPGI